jgi:hypothetical protein
VNVPKINMFFILATNCSCVAMTARVKAYVSPGAWMFVVNVVSCQAEASAPGRSLLQGSPTECVCVSECDHMQQ